MIERADRRTDYTDGVHTRAVGVERDARELSLITGVADQIKEVQSRRVEQASFVGAYALRVLTDAQGPQEANNLLAGYLAGKLAEASAKVPSIEFEIAEASDIAQVHRVGQLRREIQVTLALRNDLAFIASPEIGITNAPDDLSKLFEN